MDLLELRPNGIYCPPGDFYIDPWRPVENAVVTHAHSDHALPGHGHYIAATPGAALMRRRLGDISLETLDYGRPNLQRDVRISLHPAGHVLGSAQVKLEYKGQVWVFSGDYKRQFDPTCQAFEPQRCDVFITESTFGLPLYRWAETVLEDINSWWRANAEAGRPSVLFVYALGKAQRILAGIDASIGPLVCHGAVEVINEIYRSSGVSLPPTRTVKDGDDFSTALVLAPPSVQSTTWLRRFRGYSDAYASGWMRLRGARRRRGVDHGFALSDHADWPALLKTIEETQARRVIVTHGYAAILARYLQEKGLDAAAWDTRYLGEETEQSTVSEQEEPLA